MVFRHIGHYRSRLIGVMLAALISVLIVSSGWAAEEAVNAVYYDNPVATRPIPVHGRTPAVGVGRTIIPSVGQTHLALRRCSILRGAALHACIA